MKNNIKYLILDVDGTLTDGKIYIGNEGEQFKAFSVKDGCGIHDILMPVGITPVIITGRMSVIVQKRCAELEITEIYQGIKDKVLKLEEFLAENNSSYQNVAYIGDDINDLSCMIKVKNAGGIVGCPADAVTKVTDISDFVCTKNGGNGAVREFIEWIVY